MRLPIAVLVFYLAICLGVIWALGWQLMQPPACPAIPVPVMVMPNRL